MAFKMKGFSAFTKKTDGAKRDTVRVSDKYKVGSYIPEEEFEQLFSQKGNDPKNYPQLSVEDYSRVKKDEKGKYITRIPIDY